MNQLKFISEENLKTHILSTINHYGDRLQSFDLKTFNKNIIDPIKMIFDKIIYGYSWEDLITSEIFRQRDKANNNSIGYFHQKIFQYIEGCTVPTNGWDVIFHRENGIEIAQNFKVQNIYVEMKNKHNTMNSSAAERTYQKMQNQISVDKNSACFLVEVIAKKSQNDPWKISIEGKSQEDNRIRRVSIDKFYQIVTGEVDAFHQLCEILPTAIEEVLKSNGENIRSIDTVIPELKTLADSKDRSMLLALYSLAFDSYLGF